MIGDYVMKICLLPLDSRPCNYRFPQQLANLRGVNLIEPPIDIMDFFKTPSNSRAIADWLKINCSDADVLVVSNNAEALSKGDTSIEIPNGAGEFAVPFANAVVGQIFACSLSVLRGLNPDTPRGLSKVTITR